MDKGLTFAIHPDGQSVSVELFYETIGAVHRLVQDVDYAVAKEWGVRRWVIEELRSSIPTITIRPLVDNVPTVKALLSGLQVVIHDSLEPPGYFTEEALQHLKGMQRLFSGRGRAKRLEFSENGSQKVIVTADIGAKVERILKGGYWNLGSLEGTLEAVNLHGNPTFTIWDRVSKAPIRCYFPKDKEWKESVKRLLEKRVLVAGRINYFINGMPRSITQIRSIEDATPDPSSPKATFGSIICKEGSRDAVAFLHDARGERW